MSFPGCMPHLSPSSWCSLRVGTTIFSHRLCVYNRPHKSVMVPVWSLGRPALLVSPSVFVNDTIFPLVHIPCFVLLVEFFFLVEFFKKYLFIYWFTWLCWVLVAACRTFHLCWGVWDLAPWPQTEPRLPAMRTQNFSHWTTWEVLMVELWLMWALPTDGELHEVSLVSLMATLRAPGINQGHYRLMNIFWVNE